MRTKLWHSLTLAVLVATGFACVWGVLVGFGVSTYEMRSRKTRTYENLAVDESGEAWISQHNYSGPNPNLVTYRTLEGEPLEVPKARLMLTAGSLSTPEDDLRSQPMNWALRVNRLVETNHGEHWYTVHNGEDASGRAYMVGYDLRSKLLIGYLGKNGFQTEKPTPEQSFAVDGRVLGYNGGGFALDNTTYELTTVGSGGITLQQRRGTNEPTKVRVASAGGLMEVNLRDRVVQALDDSEAYQSVAYCNLVGRVLTAESVLEGVDPGEIKPFGEDPEFDRYYRKRLVNTLVGRRQDRVVVFHPAKQQRHEFAIPTELRVRNFNFYFISPELAVLNVSHYTGEGWFSELFWINAAGQVQKSKQVWLNRGQTDSHLTPFTIGATVAPIPLLMVAGVLAMPYGNAHLFDSSSDTPYAEVLAKVLADAWPMLVVLLLLSAVLAWIAWRWQRKYSRPHTAVWCALVFLLGVPGFVAYRLHFATPPMEKCPECGKQAPRNCDACAHCRQLFAEPVLLGTEILA